MKALLHTYLVRCPANLHRRLWLSSGILLLLFISSGLALRAATQSIARDWNEQILAAIRIDTPHPPAQARNLFSLSVCMYDTWAAYDNGALGYVYRGKHTSADIAAARREAISYAAWRILKERYSYSISASNTLAALDAHMRSLGYATSNFSTDTSTPAGVGNSVYAAVSAWFIDDGSRQAFGLRYPFVRTFALTRTDVTKPWIDPGPPPFLGGASDAEFRSNVVEVIRRSSELTPDDGVMIDISPGAFGNNTLGANDGTGRPVNPATGLPYAPNVVKRGDFARVIAEFWADGPSSETPPGHWNVLANAISDHSALAKRVVGTGPVVDDLEWDVKLYFCLNAAVHEAACAAWSLKRYYDGWRPLSAIRYMGQLGQSSDPSGPAYHSNGLPLVPNLIEIVTAATVASGRHAGLTPGKIALLSWPGQPLNPATTYRGVKWLHADAWVSYQRTNFVTPAFPGYISGHSTFSRSAAEVLAAFTGSPFFPGGMGTHTVAADSGLGFEKGPSTTVQLQWGTYHDAADEAGLSRLWGGIHPPVDDFAGRRVGSQCGQAVWALAQKYFEGSIANTPVTLTLRRLDAGTNEVRFNTVRGFYYKLQSTTNLSVPFSDEPGGATLALEGSLARTNLLSGQQKYYRAASLLTP